MSKAPAVRTVELFKLGLSLDRTDTITRVAKAALGGGFLAMLRAALTYQLILAVAVGPLLCCCTAGKTLASAPHQPAAPQSVGVRAPSDAASHSCCAHKRTAPKPAPEQKPAPAKPDAPSEKCPCKDGAGKAQFANAESAQTVLSTYLRTLTLDIFFSFAPLSAVEVVSETITPAGEWFFGHAPSLTEQLLYAHHNLRC